MRKISEHDGVVYTSYRADTAEYIQEMECICGNRHTRAFSSESLQPIVKGIPDTVYENPVIKDWKLGGSKVI